jgi:hypothetical protein
LNFDYTFIRLFGCTIFEPLVIVTNGILFIISLFCYKQLRQYGYAYARQMANFIVIMGTAGCFGAVAHAAHYQLGVPFFKVVFFISNLLNLISIYFCFRGSYTYFAIDRGAQPSKMVIRFVIAWIAILLGITLINNTFLLIKIHAGIVLIYALAVHYLAYRKKDRGSGLVVLGILISFLSIVVHSLKFSFDEWFNYKDIAHVIMIISLVIIYRGIYINTENLVSKGVKIV